jgi:hypothetical protein
MLFIFWKNIDRREREWSHLYTVYGRFGSDMFKENNKKEKRNPE